MSEIREENLGGLFEKDTKGNNSPVSSFNPQELAREVVYDWVMQLKGDPLVAEADLHMDDVYVVWFAKTLQNWKCLISTTIQDGRYYEVTFNGDLNAVYVDTYKKTHNHTVWIGI